MSINHATPIGWGILGTGNIARQFAADLFHVGDARLIGVGSRTQETAKRFGERFGIPQQYGSYQRLVNDPDVQAVYIATPASAHKDNIEQCLHAGKAVLCEKPLTINAHEAEEVFALARLKKIFLMEAMWTRFLPIMRKLRDLLSQGVIGEVHHFMADMGSSTSFVPYSRIYSHELGGGAMLQKGIYLLSLASMILGNPSTVKSFSIMGETGVDEATSVLLGYPGRRLATLWSSISVRGQRVGTIMGASGLIKIHEPITCPSTLTLRCYGNQNKNHVSSSSDAGHSLKNQLLHYAKSNRLLRILRERFPDFSDRVLHGIRSSTIFVPPFGEGLHYQVTEVNRCLRAGRLESPIMPWDESLSIMYTMDQIRNQ